MHDELEAALKELEAKLPTLRHLIQDSGGGMASPVALALAARLLRLTAMADETASNLRLALLGSNPPMPQPLPTMPLHLPEPEGTPPPAPAPPPPAEGFLNEADHALLEIFGEGIAENGTVEQEGTEIEQSLGAVDTTLDALDDAVERASDAKAELARKVETLQAKVELALKRGDRDLAIELLKEKKALLLEAQRAGIVPPRAADAEAELEELETKIGGSGDDSKQARIENIRASLRLQEEQFLKFIAAGDEESAWTILRWKETFEARLRAQGIPLTDVPELQVLEEKIAEAGLQKKDSPWISPEVLESEAFRGQLTHNYFRESLLGEPGRTLGYQDIQKLVKALPTSLPYTTALALVVRAVESVTDRPIDATTSDLIIRLFQEAGWITDEGSDDTPGNAPVGAFPKVPTPPRVPGNARTYEEALEPARNP